MATLREPSLLMHAKRSHNRKVVSSNLVPATNRLVKSQPDFEGFPFGDYVSLPLEHSWGTQGNETAGKLCSTKLSVDIR
jgi:hypothetical protein